MFLSRRREPEIALGSTFRCDPCHSLDDVAAGGLWPKEIGCIIGYVVFGAVARFDKAESCDSQVMSQTPWSAPVVPKRQDSNLSTVAIISIR